VYCCRRRLRNGTQIGDRSLVGIEDAPPASADSASIASALELSPNATAALAKAQALGREATACLLGHGLKEGPGGGIPDPTGEATAACAVQIEANEVFLNSAAFAAVLQEAQPPFDAAARCFERVSGIPGGTIVPPEDMSGELQRRFEAGKAQCFTSGGLPR
jgi:hypothetical protein